MKHYFRPGRDGFRQAVMRAMPKMLGDGAQPAVKDQVLAILEGVTARTWRRDRPEAMQVLSEPLTHLPVSPALNHRLSLQLHVGSRGLRRTIPAPLRTWV